jgi:hypothetical protein
MLAFTCRELRRGGNVLRSVPEFLERFLRGIGGATVALKLFIYPSPNIGTFDDISGLVVVASVTELEVSKLDPVGLSLELLGLEDTNPGWL